MFKILYAIFNSYFSFFEMQVSLNGLKVTTAVILWIVKTILLFVPCLKIGYKFCVWYILEVDIPLPMTEVTYGSKAIN